MSNESNTNDVRLTLEQTNQSITSTANQNLFINIPMQLIANGNLIFRKFYAPVNDTSIIERDALGLFDINITTENINHISELIFYSLIYNHKAAVNTSKNKNDIWKLIDKNVLNSFVNNILKSQLNVEQSSLLASKIWWFIEVNPLIIKWDSFTISKTYHLVYNSQEIIDRLNKLTLSDRMVDEHVYYVIVKSILKSFSIIDNASNSKEEHPKQFAKKLEKQIKAYKSILNLGHDYISESTIKNIDPTLASKHPLKGINHKDLRIDIINLDAILAKVKVQKAGTLSKSNAINRTLLCLLLLAQIFGIKMHNKENNLRGSKMREFMLIILGKNLYEKYRVKLKSINSIYFSAPGIMSSVDSIINKVNSSPSYYDDLESAYQSFAEYLTEII